MLVQGQALGTLVGGGKVVFRLQTINAEAGLISSLQQELITGRLEAAIAVNGDWSIDVPPNFGADAITDPAVGSFYLWHYEDSNGAVVSFPRIARIDGDLTPPIWIGDASEPAGSLPDLSALQAHILNASNPHAAAGYGTIEVFPATVVKPTGFIVFGFFVTSQAWANWPTNDGGSVSDIVIPNVSVGDRIAPGMQGSWFPTSTDAGYIDIVTVVGGVPVNSMVTGLPAGGAASGILGYLGGIVSTNPDGFSGTIQPYALQAGDISGGSVTIRPRARTDDGLGGPPAVGRIIFCTPAGETEFQFWAERLG